MWPRRAYARIESQKACRASTSRAAVGSSSTISAGFPTSATANRTRCVWPPESRSTRRPASSAMPASSSASATGIGAGYVPATNPTSSPTVTRGTGRPSWSIAPTRPARTASSGVPPKRRTTPSSGSFRPSRSEIVLDLPAPLRPSRATVSPRAISRSTPSTARTAPKALTAPAKETAWSAAPPALVSAAVSVVSAIVPVPALVPVFVMGTTLRIRGPAAADAQCTDSGRTNVTAASVPPI